MTREEREIIEAIKDMGYDRTAYPREKVSAVISRAIEALSEDGISDGGTLKVNVSDASKVKRVMVWGEESGGLYYPDCPKGEWIEVTNGRGGHECSNCHAYAPSYMSGDEHLSDFCPNCGADMRTVATIQTGQTYGKSAYIKELAEVVRCKDCRHRDLFSCPLADNDFQKDEDFCSWGERREE